MNTFAKTSDFTQSSDFFALALEQGEATYLNHDKLMERQTRVKQAYAPEGLVQLKTMVDAFTSGQADLTAMQFYLELEQASLLVLFHTLPRRGERNKHANGLQQTYGDHIRLMMLGFDMFDQSDIEWLVRRRWQKPVTVDREQLEASIQRYHDLKLSPSEKVAVWIASALHDYGKIFRRGYGLDAEDAAPLCADLVDALAPAGTKELIHYCIRNHDLIEHTVTGSTPTGFITEPLLDIPVEVRPRAMPMLALIQHIGAASLGEGRLAKSKLDIYNACFDGTIVADGSLEARLGRLLFGATAVPDPAATHRASVVLNQVNAEDRAIIMHLLDQTVLHGWSAVREQILEEDNDEAISLPRMIDTLALVGNIWSNTQPIPQHVVMARPHLLAKCTAGGDGKAARSNADDKSTRLLNGAEALILR